MQPERVEADEPSLDPLPDWLTDPGPDPTKPLPAEPEGDAAPSANGNTPAAEAASDDEGFAIKVYSARDLAKLKLPAPADEIVGPFVRRGMATLLGGLTGHGKTTMIARMVKLACDGGELAGQHAPGGWNVLVLDLEQHLHSIQRVIGEAGLEESDRVDYAPIPEGLAVNKRSDQLDALDEILTAKPYDVLVIDPFYKLHEAD